MKPFIAVFPQLKIPGYNDRTASHKFGARLEKNGSVRVGIGMNNLNPDTKIPGKCFGLKTATCHHVVKTRLVSPHQ